jgi:hypothetical protein
MQIFSCKGKRLLKPTLKNKAVLTNHEGSMKRKNILPCILFTGLLTGTVDILFVLIVNYHTPPAIIFRYIASGFFGNAAFGKGAAMVCYGVLFHYCIATAWSAIFLLFYPMLLNLVKLKFILTIVIGFIIWVAMNKIVIPLSRIHPQPTHIFKVIEDMVALILIYGLPVTIIGGKFYHKVKEYAELKLTDK